jgi:apolipoprotein N-acyltransferase
MRTVVIILIGLGLLAAWLLVARSVSRGRAETVRTAVLAFIAVWFVAAAVNLWIGVSQAGYSFLEELPIFLVICGIPAALAVFAGRRLR